MGNFNTIIFPKPTPSTYNENNLNLVWIPGESQDHQIPCMLLESPVETDKLIIYFHGNAEDIGYSSLFFSELTEEWGCHVLAVEYPTYGVYTQRSLSESNICSDATMIYRFLTDQIGMRPSQILIFGRSMGSGPACYLASRQEVAGLILFSPYKSLKLAAKAMVGSFMGSFVNERFRNIDAIDNVSCPLLVIHGEKDKVIPYTHGEELFKKYKHETKMLLTPSEMTHNEYRLYNDLVNPVKEFIEKFEISVDVIGRKLKIREFSPYKKQRR